MSIDNAPATEAPVESTGLNIQPTVLGELRKARASLGRNAPPIKLEIPGYDGRLVAQYQWVDADELAATADSLRRIKNATQQQIAAAADALVATNEQIYVQDTDGSFQALVHGGEPVTFASGEGLALALQQPKPRSARDCAMAVFGNTYAMVSQATRVMEWLENTSAEVDQAYLGE